MRKNKKGYELLKHSIKENSENDQYKQLNLNDRQKLVFIPNRR